MDHRQEEEHLGAAKNVCASHNDKEYCLVYECDKSRAHPQEIKVQLMLPLSYAVILIDLSKPA